MAMAEQTLGAYQLALEVGADGIECDVRLTADGHLVCVHDRRIDRTSSGRGVVSTLDLAQMDEFDRTRGQDTRIELEDKALTDPSTQALTGSVVTLERVLALVRDWERPVEVSIETKHPVRYGRLVERRLIELLDRYGWSRPGRGVPSPVRVMSFSVTSLTRCRQLAPGLELVYLMDRVPRRYRGGSLPRGVDVTGPSIDILRSHPGYVEKAHAAGHEVHSWVINTAADVELCAALGVDAVITDDPGAALRQLNER